MVPGTVGVPDRIAPKIIVNGTPENCSSRNARSQRAPSDTDNLYFYGDLAHHSPEQLARAVARRYGDAPGATGTVPAAQLDLAAQIAVNSRLTVRKLRLFNVGGALALVAAIAYSLAMITRMMGG